MDTRIALISTSGLIVDRARDVFRRHRYDYPLIKTVFDNVAKEANTAIAQGARVFISRGRSAELLKKDFDLPVVTLRFTYYDFVVALQQARQYSDRIAIVGYQDSWYHSLEQYQDILDKPLTVYLDSPAQLKDTMEALRRDGIEVIVGGFTALRAAQECGMKAVCIGLEDSSIIDSVEEALHLLRLDLQHCAHIATVNAILDSASEGIISVGPDGSITNANDSAKKLLRKDCLGDNISRYVVNSQLLQAIRGNLVLNKELVEINHVLCAVSTSPIREDSATTGVVVTFQPIKQVHSLDQNIRKKQADSGNIAKNCFENIIGQSQILLSTIETAKRFARSNGTILIFGDTGTGKEMFAQSIHNYSDRREGPFVAINCAALPQNILESELFGYVKGAFTGANAQGKAGYFETAHTGSIFLDEIGEIPLEMQIKLLRVLQEKELRRIGDQKVFHIDTRVIAASNKDLSKLVAEGKFREDLYYRLAVLELRIPPLRCRQSDPALIAEHILRDIAARENQPNKALTQEAKTVLNSLEWRGNVRQLCNVVERAFVMCGSEQIDEKLLREAAYIHSGAAEPKAHAGRRRVLSEVAKSAIATALEHERGNRKRAAKRLGISTTTLWRRISEIEHTDPGFISRCY